jgi:hypothetical protein
VENLKSPTVSFGGFVAAINASNEQVAAAFSNTQRNLESFVSSVMEDFDELGNRQEFVP